MDILKGLLLINGVDVFVDYGAFLAEEKAGDTKNYPPDKPAIGKAAHGCVIPGKRRGETA